MEGFKANPKMKSEIACFKEGGSTNMPFKKKAKEESHEDVAMDKKVVKKAVSQHEGAKHKGEPKTELKLKSGGRCKKTGGVVNRYKAGGAVAMKKDAGDKKKIANVKRMQTPKAAAPSAASAMPAMEGLQNMAGGKKVAPKFFNEEPDDMTAPPPRRAPKKMMPKPAMGVGAVSDAERQKIMDMFQGGPGSDVMRGLEAVGSYMGGGKVGC